ncbi:MAG: tRNA 2-thiouridine(34) synthase MnmA, partial [Alphaproteobacteria bacterium]
MRLDGIPDGARVVVAMSGGVDSSTVAGLLREGGYDVVGVTLQLYDHGAAVGRRGACCAGQDIGDARDVAARLGIPHYVLDYESRFREAVIDDFASSYASGETPVPCIQCNRTVKFRDLLGVARDLGAAALATGHYARRVAGPQGAELHRGADHARDQSYFLFATTQAQLDFLRFPLGGMAKEETRHHAARLGLQVAGKPDSQDICFVPDGDYARLGARLRPEAARPGDIVDMQGRVLGRHEGTIGFTVGQRRGLGIGGSPEPLYVVAVDPGAARVTVGPREALARREIDVGGFNWIGGGTPPAELDDVAVR